MPIGRRRPLLRAAMVGGAGYAAGKRAERGQEPRAEAPPAQSGGGLSQEAVDQLQKLGQLRDQGILTPAEFDAQKRALLGG